MTRSPCTPLILAIDPRWWATARVQIEDATALAAIRGEALRGARQATVRDGVAMIPVTGPLSRRDDFLSYLFGGTSYESIAEDLQRALDDPAVSKIGFDVSSPGGAERGCGELAGYIRAAGRVKPTFAHVEYAASAAYYLTSATGRVSAGPSALVGSIGCMVELVDYAEMYKKLGISTTKIVSEQSPYKAIDPSNPEDLARVQTMVNDLAAVFVRDVAKYRGVDEATVLARFGQGDVMVAARALEAGMVDQIGDFESTLAQVRGQTLSTTKIGARMETKTLAKLIGLDEGATERDISERITALGNLEREVLAATGKSDIDGALGLVRAGVEAIGERDALRTRVEAEEAARVQGEFRSTIEAALGGDRPRLTLGQLAKVVPTFLREKEEAVAKAAVAALGDPPRDGKASTWTAENLVTAICSAKATPKAVARLKSFLEAQGPALPAVAGEPAPTSANRGAVLTATKAEAARFGVKPEAVEKYGHVYSVDQLPAAAPAATQKGS